MGDDVLVVNDGSREVWRVQVKTARVPAGWSPGGERGCDVQFTTRRQQLETPSDVELTYAFLIRLHDGWGPTLLIERQTLLDLDQVRRKSNARARSDSVNFRIRLGVDGRALMLGTQDLTRFIDDWSQWPPRALEAI
ncbi:MAG: hypothetical protein H6747_16880 [Deltaproteobacteria bacterium]|nr:hypothetical protein [Deltaproteobacteria bacterium]